MYNILSISVFSLLSLCTLKDTYIRPLLLSYFIIDAYKNKWDIVIHHLIFSIFVSLVPIEYIQKSLIFEWSTLFLLLYKQKYPTKELFVMSWIGLRLIYCPYLCYTFHHDIYVINHLSLVVHYLHFHWTCKIINNRIDTTNGVYSMLLMLIPLHMLSYDVPLYTYISIYIKCQLSFYNRVFNINFLRILDTSMIMYTSLDYLNFYPWISIFYFIYRQYYDIRFHKYVFVIAVSKLCYLNYELIPCTIIGVYSLKNNHKIYTLIWYVYSGIILGYCKIKTPLNETYTIIY